MGCAALLLFAMAQAAGSGAEAPTGGPPALIVQVVDPLWLPMPGIPVAVIPAASGAEQRVGRTGQKGFTEFWLPRGAEYSVEVHSRGFKKKRIEHVRIGKSTVSPTAYVQVQLEPRDLGGPSE